MAFSPPKYCKLFAQKKAYQGEVTGTPGPPLATPLHIDCIFQLGVVPDSEFGAHENK